MNTKLPFPQRRLPVLLALCTMPLSGIALAQSSTGETATELKTIVVTASNREQELRDAPASIAVVTREDLEKKPLNDVAGILGGVEGVTLNRNGNGVPTVQLRGLGAAYTLILIDGKRVNSTNAMFRGNDYDLGWIPVADIERIEVVRGPMSSLYGSDAIGGVVNIITRKVGKTWAGSVKQELVHAEDGEAGGGMSTNFSLRGPLVADTLGLSLSGGYDKRDADKAVNTSGQSGIPRRENRYGSAKLNWTPAKDHEITTGYDYSLRDHDHFLLKREAVSLGHKGRYSFGSSEVNFYADETRNKSGTVTGETNPNKANSEALDGKLVLPVNFGFSQIVTLGGDVRRERLNDPKLLSGAPGSPGYGSDPEISVQQHAFFLEDELELNDQLRLTLGNRYDNHEKFGGNNSPRAYLVYHALPGLTFKGGVARAFRAPTLLQNSPQWGSVSCGSATTGCYIIGNADLEPETSTSREIGFQAEYGKWSGSVMAFHTDLKNMIDITSRTNNATLAPAYPNFVGWLNDGRPIFAYQNIARVRSKGVETSLRGQITAQVGVRASYTYTDTKNFSGATPLALINRPMHVANLTADWQINPRLSLAGNGRFNGNQYTTAPTANSAGIKKVDYATFDLSAAYRVDNLITLRGGVLNIDNSGVERNSSNDYNEESRRYYISVTADF
ncbi:MAG: TonB-dependent receptor [Candidatus Dactylopiibacterium carminicum]|uniref:TonB-dependent receptor n=1 Tax=Candidatus Dactylopiibacterium carminicum TaxID=857335 RepID=A0A272EMU9_9RHOO|nr:TonB-dependent receptor [Candidatus Dactylopiibacterium carminicum]KAF7597843.1 TonB-dependent receptor [Candidatus Dactylopiibacterium carminicum]PAS91433.1 MAG: TonB-dependent receptor [Candidatus Dactylopiibacterium carminicum]PAS95709.1 MAG: outer membrane receptor protein [Candidatus Dactylopiibacterium carminicum]